ncbi:MAG: GerMN domain-containing protein, partial [Lachnospiraceae bacterium]
GVKITGYQLENGLLRVDFNSSYGNLDAVSEVLCRSAVVQTLTQLKGVESVEFYVDGVPLVNQEGNPIGYMKGSDFIQNTGSTINTYQVKTLQLYFANKNGKQLNKETINVRYNSNMSVEKLIMEQLMKGPAGEEHLPIISPDTKLLGVSVKDRICYVNFDEGFLDNHYDLVPEVPIYAIVNSIIDSGMASQVQISIAGETDVTFKGTISLNKPFERNQEIIEE